MENIKFKTYNGEEIMDSLGLSLSRTRDIMDQAHLIMEKEYKTGGSIRFMAVIMDLCVNEEERIGMSIVWFTTITQMKNAISKQAAIDKMKKGEFAKSLEI